MNYIFPLPSLVLLFLSNFLEHVMGQYRLITLVGPSWVKQYRIPMVFEMLEDIPCPCTMVKHLVRDGLISWVLRGLLSMHLALWLLKGVH